MLFRRDKCPSPSDTINAMHLSPRAEAISFYSDMHKDAYGFRPRRDLSRLTVAEIDDLGQECAEEVARQIKEDEAYNAWILEQDAA